MTKTYEEIVEYINAHKIRGRYERKNIRQWMMSNFPNKTEDIMFVYPIVKEENEITYNDFKNFLEND